MRYVIIGNSTAAVGCVEGIRAEDKNGEITIISNECYHTYSRPLISYLLLGKTDMERMKYRPDDFYIKNNVKTLLGKTVARVGKNFVYLETGEILPFDKLMLATGSIPFVPPFAGLETVSKKFSFMSLDDALALSAELNSNTRVLILGAGLIGLKCAEGIYNRVKQITVVDLSDRILPSILNENAAAVAKKNLDAKGIQFYLNDTVAEFKENTAVLKSGEIIAFDVLVTAVGVRPNIQLAADLAVKINRGIEVAPTGETSVKNVYAAGDCCESYDISSDTQKILALLPNAYMQGRNAGIHMAGGTSVFKDAIPMNAIGFFGTHILSAGTYCGECYEKITDDSYKALYYENHLLKGYILIGQVARAGIYTSLIKNKVDLRTVDFDLLKENPQLIAFKPADRSMMINEGVAAWKSKNA